ncbi:MAG: PA14 domain-containing protein [Verrucomicrobia bacterium]|nr:PA14 domain-containing protein [Verrucomicrobiota bacterium]
MRKTIIAAFLALLGVSAQAGEATFDFTADPATTLEIAGNNPQPWMAAGGNPGGFLAITYPVGSQYTGFVFPDIDDGKIVTAFKFEADLRVGNSTGARPADGFSISFARGNDPLLTDIGSTGNFAGGIPEGGSTTGIAISFDTWAGNTFPDGPDIEGIIVRVDNKTILRQPLPTRHGACDDITSLQTGPRNAQYFTDGGDPYEAGSWAGLCWKPVVVEVDDTGKVTVIWKGNAILDKFQTSYFPSAGRIVLAGRTGGANENTHIDNIRLTTVASSADTQPPTAPGNVKATPGARRVSLDWDASTDNSGRVGYEVDFDGAISIVTDARFAATGLNPNTAYSFRVRAVDVSGNGSAWQPVSATTVAEVDGPGFLLGEIYDGIPNVDVASLVFADAFFDKKPSRGVYLNGLTFGEPTFGGTFGDNFGIVITGVLTAPKTGMFNFFLRSDDASQFFLNQAGAAIPNIINDLYIAEETGCCNAFQEPGALQTTAAPVSLTAGKQYGFAFAVKEGGGGDWGQVAMREVGDPTPAAQLQPISGAILTGKGDPVGAEVSITKAPADVTTPANEKVTFTVEATHASPYGAGRFYQWYRNGTVIAGASGASYLIPFASAADNGAKFKVMVGTLGKAVTSAEATLTVQADTKPPTIASVSGSDTFDQVTILFSEPVTSATATVAGNYSFSGGLTVSAATLVNVTTARLTTSKQAESTDYTLTVSNLRDNGGNAIAAPGNTATLKSFSFTSGISKLEVWTGIGGVAVTDLTGDARFPASPDLVQTLSGFEAPTDVRDNFGGRLTGFITPTETASYVFYMAADDGAELFLSTNDSPANKSLIATEPTWNPARAWSSSDRRPGCPDACENVSAPIRLESGKRYFIELLFKEGGGGDNAGVAWVKEGQAPPANGSAPIGGANVGIFADPNQGPPVITTSPSTQLADAGGSASFTVESLGGTPFSYQWRFNGGDIAGGTQKTLAVSGASAAKVGGYSVVVSNSSGTITSTSANLFIKGTLYIEAEDFDFGGGKSVTGKPIGLDGAYPGGDYAGLGTMDDADIDWSNAGGNAGQPFRPDTGVAAGKQNAHADGIPRAGFDVTVNNVVGWNDDGDWQNYTRVFPANDYNIIGRLASGGLAIHSQVSVVTAGVGTKDQTLKKVGEFNPGRATAGWDNMELFPLIDETGALSTVNLSGKQTVRWSTLPGANQDIDYMMFIPAVMGSGGGGGGSTISGVSLSGGSIKFTFTGTLESADSVIGPWTAVPNAASPASIPVVGDKKFYRVR